MRQRLRSRSLFVAGVTLGVITVVSCSSPGGSASGSSGSSTSSASSSSSSQPLTKVTLGQVSPATSATPVYVAVNHGFFKDDGLDVQVQTLSGGTQAAFAALATGSVDILAGTAIDIVQYAAQKVGSGKIFGEIEDQNYDVVSSKNITSIRDLSGKVIGISGPNGGDQIYLEAVLAENGVDKNDVTFIATGSSSQRLTALSAGKVDAIAASHLTRASSESIGTVLLKSTDSTVQFPGSVYFSTDSYRSGHEDVLKKYISALVAATNWIKTHQSDAVADCVQGSGSQAADCQQAIQAATDPSVAGQYTWSSTYAVNTAGIESAIQIVNEFVVTPGAKDLTVSDLVDTSIAGTPVAGSTS
jgi:NitT/TauT family transport system substrate-binding protein